MKKFLSIFIALAMVLSLFAGFGVHSAKADSTFMVTPSGSFVGGVDGSGTAAVNGAGTLVSYDNATGAAVVNVTTAAAGSFDTASKVRVLHAVTTHATIDTDWYNKGYQWITLDPAQVAPAAVFAIGQTITVGASGTFGSGKIVSINPEGTLAYVNVTTAATGAFTGTIYTSSKVASTDPNWETVSATQSIALPAGLGLTAGDLFTVYMNQQVPATSASAFFMVSGTVSAGDVATVTFQDSAAASHTVTYTAKAGDTAATVAQTLSQLIDAMDAASGYNFVYTTYTPGTTTVMLTQENAGTIGNGKTLTATTTAAASIALTVRTVGGLTQPAYVEQGKTIQLVALNQAGTVIPATYSPATTGTYVSIDGNSIAGTKTSGGIVLGITQGVQLINVVGSNGLTTTFVVVVIAPQVVTKMAVNLVAATPASTSLQQFAAIAGNTAYPTLDYTTDAAWTDTLPVASISNASLTQGRLSYSSDETGNVTATAPGVTTTVAATIKSGVITLAAPSATSATKKVIVLSIGSDIATVDDKATTVDAAPEIVNGRTFVPIRFIAETFGSTVTWLPDTKGITITLGNTTIGLQIGNATAVVNNNIIALEAASYIKNSRTMVPLRVITESFGGDVAWDAVNHIITITYTLPAA